MIFLTNLDGMELSIDGRAIGIVTASISIPNFRFDTIEISRGNYTDEVDTAVPIQRLDFRVDAKDLTATAGRIGEMLALTFSVIQTREDQNANRRKMEIVYSGKLAAANRMSGILLAPTYTYKCRVSPWVMPSAIIPKVDWETLTDIDLPAGKYIGYDGVDRLAARRATLGLT